MKLNSKIFDKMLVKALIFVVCCSTFICSKLFLRHLILLGGFTLKDLSCEADFSMMWQFLGGGRREGERKKDFHVHIIN